MVQLVFFAAIKRRFSYYTEAPKYYTTKGKKKQNAVLHLQNLLS
jgi:hypothetical protein